MVHNRVEGVVKQILLNAGTLKLPLDDLIRLKHFMTILTYDGGVSFISIA